MNKIIFLFPAGEDEGPESQDATSLAQGQGIPPTFIQKPQIVPNDTGTIVTMIFRLIVFLKTITAGLTLISSSISYSKLFLRTVYLLVYLTPSFTL